MTTTLGTPITGMQSLARKAAEQRLFGKISQLMFTGLRMIYPDMLQPGVVGWKADLAYVENGLPVTVAVHINVDPDGDTILINVEAAQVVAEGQETDLAAQLGKEIVNELSNLQGLDRLTFAPVHLPMPTADEQDRAARAWDQPALTPPAPRSAGFTLLLKPEQLAVFVAAAS